MSQIRKRLLRLINNPVGVEWSELRTILKYYGCIIEESSGSHKVVYHPTSSTNVTVSIHNNKVKVIYVKKCIELLEEVIEEEE
ncbi:type II toxin-antitoxin system HicA family toxin [Syntrophomonas wolfei]|uniref:Type II toxin-antitoxin system HicA family toxin n=1 Tax=Syntrophomonas wolfei subsp. wolfei (strain DSM 2245B / Goettingen) TaxID=335541 RepID=Q0AZE8_SYNWW|nr:type II toxin-antitoxin system HicA family toxin [Syntrophomonas wolfei]ABI67906.1 conserved hypothetical protein [Syntrophomonas wolfei subsp. wolfei str. Goettingen G311]